MEFEVKKLEYRDAPKMSEDGTKYLQTCTIWSGVKGCPYPMTVIDVIELSIDWTTPQTPDQIKTLVTNAATTWVTTKYPNI